MAVKLDEARIRLLKTNGTTTIAGGHVYLTGSSASSSTSNTTQLVFGTSSSNHVVLSSNDNALVINPTTSSTTNQIVLYLNQKAKFPSGIDAGTGGITTTGNISGNYIQGAWLYTSAATAQTTTSKIAVIHSDNYIYYITPANLTTLIKNNASGTWAISISGNAATASSVAWGNVTGKPSTFTPSSHTHSYIASKGNYTFDSSTLPNSFDLGLSCGFVNSDSGFGSYGGVITHRAYSGGGGSLQLYSPYSSNYGGTHLKARFGNYSVSSGNSWTDLKEIAWVSDIPTKISQLTNDASGTWSISISGNAATTTAFSSAASISLNGDVTGSASSTKGWSITTTANKISYPAQLTTDDTINNFNAANKFQVATWNSTSSPGVSNGIIMSGGWTSTSYGWQIAIDDDPTWYIALRQRDGNGWKAWKRIPMGDGTGASGDWSISITGSSASCTGNAATASAVAWSGITGKPSTFTPSSHTHSYITSKGATVANTRTPAYSESLITGGWASADAGYGSTYGTTLDISGYSTWYHRLAFHTGGQIDYWMGINTTTLTKQSTLITSANYSSYALPKYGGTLTGNLSIQKASWGTFAFKNENGNSLAQIAISNSTNAFDGKLTFRCYSSASAFSAATLDNAGVFTANQVKGAVWNDYAEYRWVLNHPDTDEPIESGRCVAENGNDSMSLTHDRLQAGARIISDTYGMCMGETEKAKTPIAVCGRVLAYPFERKVAFNVGDPVCSGPNGTVSKMSREEAMMYPERIVGTVVSKPTYKEWGPNKIPVKGRIWIQVR